MSTLLSAANKLWTERAQLARDHKETEFGALARDAMRFYSEGVHDFMYSSEYAASSLGFLVSADSNCPSSLFRMTVSKTYEVVSIFLPFLYHKNPTRLCRPRLPRLPGELFALMGQPAPPPPPSHMQRILVASLMDYYLNATPNEYDLVGASRLAIVDALVKGRGILWPELKPLAGGAMMTALSYVNVDDLLIDSDATSVADAGWVMRRRVRRIFEVERERGLPRGTLKTNLESDAQRSYLSASEDGAALRRRGTAGDLVEYYELYSRVGIGSRLAGAGNALSSMSAEMDDLGDFIYLEICPGHDYPLNLPPDLFASTASQEAIVEIQARLAWPTPFHKDPVWPWPFAMLDFVPRAGKVWPNSHIAASLGYQKFLNWAYSLLASKMRWVTKDTILLAAGLDEEVKEALLSPVDLAVAQVKTRFNQTDKVVEVVQGQRVHVDLIPIVQMIQREFEKSTGVNDISYGQQSRQMRSATEAQVMEAKASDRPEAFAEVVESWMSQAARMEAVLARTHLTAQDVAVVFGEDFQQPMLDGGAPFAAMGPFTQAWEQVVHSDDMGKILAEMEYTIEGGSVRKPNPATESQEMTEQMNQVFPLFVDLYKQTGDPTLANGMLRRYSKAMRYPNVEEMMLPDLRQQQQQQQQAQQPAPEGQPPPEQGSPQPPA